MASRITIVQRCGCRDADGRQLGTRCPQLGKARHGGWGYVIDAGSGPGGARRRARQSKLRTRDEAQRAANLVAVQIDQGTWLPPAEQAAADAAAAASAPRDWTYGQWATAWLEEHARTGAGLRPSTEAMYRRYLADAILPSPLADLRLVDVGKADVQRFVAWLTEERHRPPTTVRRILAVVRVSLTTAVHDDLILRNPATGVRLPSVQRQEHVWWTPQQVGVFLDAAASHRLSALYETAVFCGLRRGELLGLKWADVDLQRATVTVRRARVQIPGQVVEGAPKTDNGRRTIDLDESTVGALLAWRLTQQAEADAWGSAWQDAGWVFTREDGTPLAPQFASKQFDKIRDAAGLPHIPFHGLRHLAASLMLDGGANLMTVSRVLGHGDIRITADTYGHLVGAAARRAVTSAVALVPRGHTPATQPVPAGK